MYPGKGTVVLIRPAQTFYETIRLRQSVILLKIAAETDPRAARYLQICQDALVETASVLKAMEELKAFVLQEKKARKKEKEREEKKALRVVGKVNLHENGKATI